MTKRESSVHVFTVELPDAETALAAAREIASRNCANIVVKDENGNELGSAPSELFIQKLKIAFAPMKNTSIRELVDKMEARMTSRPTGQLQ